jgi:nitroreductase
MSALPNASNTAPTDWAAVAADLIQARQTVLPKRLVAPGPQGGALDQILAAASAAPDHGQITPWRFVLVPDGQRARLGEMFVQALVERDAQASAEQREQAREKAFRAPLLMLAVVDATRGDPDVDLHERILSAGCAVQNMLLVATALGFGSALTSGKAIKSHALRTGFGLSSDEHALCFVSIGTVASRKPLRLRPATTDYVSTLGDPGTL